MGSDLRFYEVIVKVVVRRDSVAQAAKDVEEWLVGNMLIIGGFAVAGNPSRLVSAVRVLGAKDISDQIHGGSASEP